MANISDDRSQQVVQVVGDGPGDLPAAVHSGVVRRNAGDRDWTRHNIAMSSLPGFVLPGDVSANQRYWEEDIIEPEVEVTGQGTILVPTTPGLGYSVRRKRIEQLRARQQVFHARNAQVSVEGAA